MKKMFLALLAIAVLVFGFASPAQAAKPAPRSAALTVQYNINKYVDNLNTWQVNNSTGEAVLATLEIVNDETDEVTITTFYVSSSTSLSKNIVQPTPRNPGETATLIVNGTRLNTAVASEWDALFQPWESPKAGYINILTGEVSSRP